MQDYRATAAPLIVDFLHFEKKAKDHSDATIEQYYLDLRTFFRFMKQERGIADPDTTFEEIDVKDISIDFIRGITKVDINNFVDYLRSDRLIHVGCKNETTGMTATSTQRKVACLKSFFHYLCDTMDYLDKNPTIGVIVPAKRKSLPAYLTEEESRRLLDAVKGVNATRDYAIILLFLTCGLRVSELVGINISDIRHDQDQRFLNIIGKGHKERQVYIADSSIAAIDDYLTIRKNIVPLPGYEDALFLSQKRNRMSVDAVQKMVKKALSVAGLSTKKFSVHKLRHTAATLMLQNGVDVRTLMEVLGHADLSSTQIYAHVSNGELRTASKANPLSRIVANATVPAVKAGGKKNSKKQ